MNFTIREKIEQKLQRIEVLNKLLDDRILLRGDVMEDARAVIKETRELAEQIKGLVQIA
jgi:hypothetical protein